MKRLFTSNTVITGAMLLFFSILSISSSQAQSDQINLEDDLGARIEDAYATAFRNREIQTSVRYRRTADKENELQIAPAFEYGIFRNTQIEVSIPFYGGNAHTTGGKDIRVSGLYNFNQESVIIPAIAIVGRAVLPTGDKSEGVDLMGRFIITKTITSRLDRIHINFDYNYNSKPADHTEDVQPLEERSKYITATFGYSGRIGPTTVVVVDYVWDQTKYKNQIQRIAELALREQVTPRLVLSLGAGVGFGEDSPKLQGNFGFQRAF